MDDTLRKHLALDTAALEQSRERTRAAFRDPHRSPFAAVARHELSEGRRLLLGTADDADVRLDDPALKPRHLRLEVRGERFSLRAVEQGATFVVHQRGAAAETVREADVGPGTRVDAGRFTLRLSHQNFPAVLVLDPRSPKLAAPPELRWYPPAPALRVQARLVREAQPREEVVLSTRGNRRRGLRVGHFEFAVDGAPQRLAAVRLLEPGVGEADVSVFFRDATTGKETYPVGRYVEPEHVAGDDWILDFNRAYNPTCAFSELYNCPIPPRENVLRVPIRAGELVPGGH